MTETGQGMSTERCSSTSRTRDVLCPFFIAHGRREIHCEAYDDACRNVMRYRCAENKDEHMKTYCCCRYDYCEHYIGLMQQKYEED